MRRGVLGALGGFLLATVACTSMLRAPAAIADVGVGIGAAPIIVPGVVRPGETVTRQGVYVVNTGNARTVYELRADKPVGKGERAAPAGWVRFRTKRFSLGAKRHIVVLVTIAVPRSASDGTYHGRVVATSVAVPGGSQIGVGAAAETLLQFRVAHRGFHIPRPVGRAAVGVVGVAAVFIALRKVGLRIRIER